MTGCRKIQLLILLACFGIQTCPQPLYIKAMQVFDGKEFQSSKIIAINSGIITDLIDPQVQLPDTVQIIDATDCTVLPGLIDSHTHFMGASLPYITEIEKHSFGKLACDGISLAAMTIRYPSVFLQSIPGRKVNITRINR